MNVSHQLTQPLNLQPDQVQYLIKLIMFVADPVKEPVVAPGGLEDADVWGDAPNVSTLSHEHRPLKERV